MGIKLIKACKDLNIGMSTAIDFCAKMGRPIAMDPNTRIDDDLYLLLAQQFGGSTQKMSEGIKSISFKNFRKFAHLTPLQIKSITYLVGGNNAGKSTVVKALRLVMENLKHLQSLNGTSFLAQSTPIFQFDIKDAHVGTFSKALLRTAKEKKIVFDVDISSMQNVKMSISPITDQSPIANIDNLRLTDQSVQTTFEVDTVNNKMRIYSLGATSLDELDDKIAKYKDEQAQLKNQSLFIHNRLSQSQLILPIAVRQGLMDELANMQEREANVASMIKKLEANRKSLGNSNEGELLAEFNLSANQDNLADNLLIRLMRGMQTHLSIQNRKTQSQKNNIPVIVQNIDQMILNYAVALASDNLEYIGAHAATQKTIFSVDDCNDSLVNILHEWKKLRIMSGEAEYQFVLDWMREWNAEKQKGLGIGCDFVINEHYGEAYSIQIQEHEGDTEWASLSELGMGAIQMVTLLLRLACIMRKYKGLVYKPLIMIEEPEQNMHPNWQSHLADIFDEMRSQGFRLLVETHSEYLIRKSQLQVAAMKFVDQADLDENCSISTWYFPDKEAPYAMQYTPQGGFVKPFGSGFFDEAAKMDIEIIRNEQQNITRRRK